MTYLLDVNVLVAWGWSDHTDHLRVTSWLHDIKTQRNAKLLTSAIPQLGFVRVSVQRSQGIVTPQKAGTVLLGMLEALGPAHRFLPDDQPATHLPKWCQKAATTTDAHLLELASAHQALLATLDTGINGAYLIPALPKT
jgi:predicted nucleic acid-binding protein